MYFQKKGSDSDGSDDDDFDNSFSTSESPPKREAPGRRAATKVRIINGLGDGLDPSVISSMDLTHLFIFIPAEGELRRID